jgi:centromeric protein E
MAEAVAVAGNVYVAVRLRPLNEVELFRSRDVSVWRVSEDGNTLRFEDSSAAPRAPPSSPAPPAVFVFDRVFAPDAPNEAVYAETCAPLVRSALAGISGTIFAYGATARRSSRISLHASLSSALHCRAAARRTR